MKVWILFVWLFCSLNIFSFGQDIAESDTEDVRKLSDTSTCGFDFIAGVEDVILGQTTIKEVLEIYGKAEIERERVPFSFDMGKGFSITKISYDQEGLEFRCSKDLVKNKRGKKRVNVIVISKNCKCLTKEGFGIGSSYEELSRYWQLKEGQYIRISNPGGNTAEITFDYVVSGGGEVTIRLIGYYTPNRLDFRVREIVMFYNEK